MYLVNKIDSTKNLSKCYEFRHFRNIEIFSVECQKMLYFPSGKRFSLITDLSVSENFFSFEDNIENSYL